MLELPDRWLLIVWRFSCPRGGLFYGRWLVLSCFVVLWFLVGGRVCSVGSALLCRWVLLFVSCITFKLCLGCLAGGCVGGVVWCVLGFKDALGGGLLCLGLFCVVCGVVFNLRCVYCWGCGVWLMVFDCWACGVVGVLVVLLVMFSGVVLGC